MSEYTDFLIVGGGISGLSLHWRLKQEGLNSVLIDLPTNNHSTSIAAGIINPIAGKFFSLAWRADEIFAELESFYPSLEKALNSKFFYPTPIKRIFKSAGEQNQWLSKAHREKYRNYCRFDANVASSEFGQLMVQRGGWVNTTQLLKAMREHFMQDKSLLIETFDYKAFDPQSCQYGQNKFDAVVFCEGWEMRNNPWFKHLPITPNKGEILELYCEELPQDSILISGVFVLPMGEHRFKLGASYDHHNLSLLPTKAKREELLSRFKQLCPYSFEVIDHQIGMRPAVVDRRPLMGKHHDLDKLFVFNGLGSKGLSMSPLLSIEMRDYLLNNKELHPESNILRFT